MLSQCVFTSAVNRRTLTAPEEDSFLHAYDLLERARAQNDTGAREIQLDIISKILARTCEFNEAFLAAPTTNNTLLEVFFVRASDTSAAAHAFVYSNLLMAITVAAQFLAHTFQHKEYAKSAHAAAGLCQCMGTLVAVFNNKVPGRWMGVCLIGLMQLLSDAFAQLPAHMQTDTEYLQHRSLSVLVDNLVVAGKLDKGMWPNSKTSDFSLEDDSLLWGHYACFTFIFMARALPLSRFGGYNIWRSVYATVLLGTCLAPAVVQSYRDTQRLPTSKINNRISAIPNGTMRIPLFKNAYDTIVPFEMLANYMIVLAVAYVEPLTHVSSTIHPILKQNATELTHILPAEKNLNIWRDIHAELTANATAKNAMDESGFIPQLAIIDSVFDYIRSIASPANIAETCIQDMKKHLERNSLAFKTLVPKLYKRLGEEGDNQFELVNIFFEAVRPSIEAFVWYAAVGHRGPDEVVYATVFAGPEKTGVSIVDFSKLVEDFDARLTEILKSMLWPVDDADMKLANAWYARDYLVNYEFTRDILNVGFWDDSKRSFVSNFPKTGVIRATPARIGQDNKPIRFYKIHAPAEDIYFDRHTDAYKKAAEAAADAAASKATNSFSRRNSRAYSYHDNDDGPVTITEEEKQKRAKYFADLAYHDRGAFHSTYTGNSFSLPVQLPNKTKHNYASAQNPDRPAYLCSYSQYQ